MIQANEFRQGNLVQDTFKNIHPIQWIDNTGVETEYGRFPFDRVLPIPITSEWIERLGFKKYDFMEVPSYKEPYYIDIHNGNTISERELFVISNGMVQIQQIYEKDITSCVFPINVKYVHQLQNLYHAITGNELKIK